ncbi:excalibur calcium-binding domain-containing protein [Psychrobacter sp. I-STPA6b]|uniref:excalibur calcium-binding domain-containing protein n=1 Tax=Psychrobacter sp. I-STPA6b TaxID=2585718 RepID=UPI001D0C14CA|nr:excalibur calcium-binding domain-containing protein [Psychrobacter sp. I-STPA6b]
MNKIKSILLSSIAWFWGVTFALFGFVAIFKEGFIVGLLMFLGGLALLPPIKKIIIQKIPNLNRAKLTVAGSVMVFASMFGFSPPEDEMQTTEVVATTDANIVTDENPWDKEIVPATPPVDNQPQALLSVQEAQSVEPVAKPEPAPEPEPEVKPEPSPVVVESKPKPTPKPQPVKTAPSSNNCAGLPRRCSDMSSCEQAYQALRCGNTRLDRDRDGIPCESIC